MSLRVLHASPEVSLYGGTSSDDAEFHVYISFSEAVSGLSDEDFGVTNGTVSGTRSTSQDNHDTHQTALENRYYRTTVRAEKPGTVEVSLPAGVVLASNGGAPNLVSNTLSIECLADFGAAWVVDDSDDWSTFTHSSVNMDVSGGQASPTADSSSLKSEIYTVDRLRKPK